jgi:hypothetical protein
MTERQARDWPRGVAEAQQYVETSTIPLEITHHEWTVRWEEESRPGRGHGLSAVFCDGEYVVQIMMDVYGGPRVAVAETNWIHNGFDEECDCEHCEAERREDAEPADPVEFNRRVHLGLEPEPAP